MMGTYEVYLDGQQVGSASCDKEGLYYRIICSCDLPTNGRYRLRVKGELGTESIGILIPSAGKQRLRRRVALKRIGEGKLEFLIEQENADQHDHVIPVSEGEPFDFLQDIPSAKLVYRDEKPCLFIPEKNQKENEI